MLFTCSCWFCGTFFYVSFAPAVTCQNCKCEQFGARAAFVFQTYLLPAVLPTSSESLCSATTQWAEEHEEDLGPQGRQLGFRVDQPPTFNTQSSHRDLLTQKYTVPNSPGVWSFTARLGNRQMEKLLTFWVAEGHITYYWLSYCLTLTSISG